MNDISNNFGRELSVGFTGSRQYPRKDLVENFVRALARKYPTAQVISGGRGNVDETAEKTALLCGLEVISYRPLEEGIEVWRWDAGAMEPRIHPIMGYTGFVKNCFFRNTYIATCDRVVGFWNLESRGTADTLSKSLGHISNLTVAYGPEGASLTPEQLRAAIDRVLG